MIESLSGKEIDDNQRIFTYCAERIIGNGSFGVVYKAHRIGTHEEVAIKKVYQDKRYKNREFQIMRCLSHPNIVQLLHAFYTVGEKQDELFLNLVMEYVPETVHHLLKYYNNRGSSLPLTYVKLYTFQLARALAYTHAMGYCHRDIKPHNLLINPKTNELKLCDFGSAKKLLPNESNVAYICSRYYRAPELIFGATEYTTSIDTWSFGCVLAEMLLGKPLFKGNTGVDQLAQVVKVLGTPTRDDLQSMSIQFSNFMFPKILPINFNTLFSANICPNAIDLLLNLLKFDPKKRLSMIEVLAHPFFDELKQVNNTSTPNLFNFTSIEINSANSISNTLIYNIIPNQYINTILQNHNNNNNPQNNNICTSPKFEARALYIEEDNVDELSDSYMCEY